MQHNTTIWEAMGQPNALEVGQANEWLSFVLMSCGQYRVTSFCLFLVTLETSADECDSFPSVHVRLVHPPHLPRRLLARQALRTLPAHLATDRRSDTQWGLHQRGSLVLHFLCPVMVRLATRFGVERRGARTGRWRKGTELVHEAGRERQRDDSGGEGADRDDEEGEGGEEEGRGWGGRGGVDALRRGGGSLQVCSSFSVFFFLSICWLALESLVCYLSFVLHPPLRCTPFLPSISFRPPMPVRPHSLARFRSVHFFTRRPHLSAWLLP